MAKFSEVLRVLRKKRGYTQTELAKLMGITRSALGNYESGIREPDLDTIEAFADFFDVSVADLIGRENDDPPVESPKTKEARMISSGIDKMPPEERKRAVELMELMFAKYYKE